MTELPRLLGSHSSVFNALTNPDLDSEWRSTACSVLSSEDDDDSLVIVSSVISNDSSDSLHDTFVMPRMSVSGRALRVTVLSESAYQNDTAQLIDYIKSSNNRLDIHHVSLSGGPVDDRLIQQSDLLFIVNDGSFVFVDYLQKVLRYHEWPKLTVINMMTVNYFINLFDLINSLRPCQMWKTPSLKHQNILDKVVDFIDLELHNRDSSVDPPLALTAPDSMYSSLTSSRKPNYKQLEKQFKLELSADSNVDPLRMNKNFSFVGSLWTLLQCDPEPSKLYMALSFALGISLGVGLASGMAMVVHSYVAQSLSTLFADPPKPPVAPEPLHPVSILTKISDIAADFCQEKLPHLHLVQALSSAVDGLRMSSSFVMEYVRGGLEKVVGVFLYSFY